VPTTRTSTVVSAGLVMPVIFDYEDIGFCVSLVIAHGLRRLITVLSHEAPISADEGLCGLPAEESCPPGIQSPTGWL
jgi:hypothetical protein